MNYGLLLVLGIVFLWLTLSQLKENKQPTPVKDRQKISLQAFPYDEALKQMAFSDISFNAVALDEIPKPYFKDYSHHQSATARNYKSYDTLGFRDTLLTQLSERFPHRVLKLMIITPKNPQAPYDAFAYLSNQTLAGLHLPNSGNFKLWMDIIFEKQEQDLEKYRQSGQFEQQPELNPHPQFMLTLGQGQFSQEWVNSGMMFDQRPYEKTGAYLHKKAPRIYNAVQIATEKQAYLKQYINTTGDNIDEQQLKARFDAFIKHQHLTPNPPIDNTATYQDFEALAGYPFPQSLQVLLREHNGIENTGFLTAEQILAEWKAWKSIYDDVNWTLLDLTENNLPDGKKTLGIYTNPYWIPFFSTGDGNAIAIDYTPASEGQSGQIIAFGADEIKIRLLAEDMSDFLQRLRSDSVTHGIKGN